MEISEFLSSAGMLVMFAFAKFGWFILSLFVVFCIFCGVLWKYLAMQVVSKKIATSVPRFIIVDLTRDISMLNVALSSLKRGQLKSKYDEVSTDDWLEYYLIFDLIHELQKDVGWWIRVCLRKFSFVNILMVKEGLIYRINDTSRPLSGSILEEGNKSYLTLLCKKIRLADIYFTRLFQNFLSSERSLSSRLALAKLLKSSNNICLFDQCCDGYGCSDGVRVLCDRFLLSVSDEALKDELDAAIKSMSSFNNTLGDHKKYFERYLEVAIALRERQERIEKVKKDFGFTLAGVIFDKNRHLNIRQTFLMLVDYFTTASELEEFFKSRQEKV